MRISDWSSDVCSSDLPVGAERLGGGANRADLGVRGGVVERPRGVGGDREDDTVTHHCRADGDFVRARGIRGRDRKSVVSGKRVSVRVDIGGRRSIKKKKNNVTK